jgi:hypothetical protein
MSCDLTATVSSIGSKPGSVRFNSNPQPLKQTGEIFDFLINRVYSEPIKIRIT